MDQKTLHQFFLGQTTVKEDENIKTWLNSSIKNQELFIRERKYFDLLLLNTKEIEMKELYTTNAIFLSWSKITQIIVVFLITLLGSGYYFTQVYNNKAASMQTIKVPAGQHINITLSDGTNIWLNSKTTLHYPAIFNKRNRTVILDGQGYFNVALNTNAPFIVETPFGNIQALGTTFDVLAYSDIKKYEAVLINGKIKVQLKDAPDQTKILTPNHKSYLENGELKTIWVDDFTELQWKEGLIGFKNEPFEKIIKTFEKVFDIRIIIENSSKYNNLYTSKFRISDGVDYAIRVLQKDAHFTFERNIENNTITIY